MKNNKILAIRCLAYNHERTIRQCLEGFVNQKTKYRFDVIVHDDASTDNTASIIREYEKKYPDIIKPIYEKENHTNVTANSYGIIPNNAVCLFG